MSVIFYNHGKIIIQFRVNRGGGWGGDINGAVFFLTSDIYYILSYSEYFLSPNLQRLSYEICPRYIVS